MANIFNRLWAGRPSARRADRPVGAVWAHRRDGSPGHARAVPRPRRLPVLLGWPGVVALVVSAAWPVPAGAQPYRVATVEFVVQLSRAAETDPGPVLGALPGPAPVDLPGDRWLFREPAGEAAYFESRLAHQRGVTYVAPDQPVRAAGTLPANPCYFAACGPTQPIKVENPTAGAGATQVHPTGETDLWAINAPQAWAITEGDPDLMVAVLDTGVSTANPQLQGKVVQGPDVCADDDRLCASPNDNNGHGTFVAGLIAANDDQPVGMASLGWDVKVMSIKILDDKAQGGTADEATGIYDAVNLGAKVINLSTSDYPCNINAKLCGPNPDIRAAVRYALAHGVVVVGAAGNWDEAAPVYPASYPGVLAVAAATDQGAVDPANGGAYLDFSEYGDAANIAAPGVDLLSTWYDGNYAVDSGTSFAVPLVSAAAALVLSADPALSAAQVSTLIESTAAPLGGNSAPLNGGFLNVGEAVEDASDHYLPSTVDGYHIAAANGNVLNAGAALSRGSLKGHPISHPVVGIAADADGLGYWLATANGRVFAFGDVHNFGSASSRALRRPIVGIEATPDGRGYWLVAADGGVFAFGDARFYGSAGDLHLRQPIVGLAPTPDGHGYWLAARDGGVFAFGDANFWGSGAKMDLGPGITAIAATSDGGGYWLVGADGSVYCFGDAPFYGSEKGSGLSQPIVGLAASPWGMGYWLLSAGGQVFDFGGAPYEVAVSASGPGAPAVGLAA